MPFGSGGIGAKIYGESVLHFGPFKWATHTVGEVIQNTYGWALTGSKEINVGWKQSTTKQEAYSAVPIPIGDLLIGCGNG